MQLDDGHVICNEQMLDMELRARGRTLPNFANVPSIKACLLP